MSFNSNSGLGNGDTMGNSASNAVTGVPEPVGARPGEPSLWLPFKVIW